MDDDYERHFMAVTEKVMTDSTPLPVLISIAQCWLLISGLQLCCRHPELSPFMREQLEDIGRQFQESIVSVHPEALELLEMGWNEKFDR